MPCLSRYIIIIIIITIIIGFWALLPSLDHLLGCPLSPFISHSAYFLHRFLVYRVLALSSLALPFLSPLRRSTILVTLSAISTWSCSSRFEMEKHYESLVPSCHQLEGDSSFVHLPSTHKLLGWCGAGDSSWWKVRELASISLPPHFMLFSGGLIFWRHNSFFLWPYEIITM